MPYYNLRLNPDDVMTDSRAVWTMPAITDTKAQVCDKHLHSLESLKHSCIVFSQHTSEIEAALGGLFENRRTGQRVWGRKAEK